MPKGDGAAVKSSDGHEAPCDLALRNERRIDTFETRNTKEHKKMYKKLAHMEGKFDEQHFWLRTYFMQTKPEVVKIIEKNSNPHMHKKDIDRELDAAKKRARLRWWEFVAALIGAGIAGLGILMLKLSG